MRMLFKYRFKNELRINAIFCEVDYIPSYGLINNKKKFYLLPTAVFILMRKLEKSESRYELDDEFFRLAVKHMYELVIKHSEIKDVHPKYISQEENQIKEYASSLWIRLTEDKDKCEKGFVVAHTNQ